MTLALTWFDLAQRMVSLLEIARALNLPAQHFGDVVERHVIELMPILQPVTSLSESEEEGSTKNNTPQALLRVRFVLVSLAVK